MSKTGNKVLLRDIEVDAYLADCVRIEPLALEEEFTRMPGDLAYWSERYVEAYQDFANCKRLLEQQEALLAVKYRHKIIADNMKPTEAMIHELVVGDSNYQLAYQNFITAEVAKIRLNGILEALRTKKDMIISTGAHQRAEMGFTPHMRADARSAGRIAEQQRERAERAPGGASAGPDDGDPDSPFNLNAEPEPAVPKRTPRPGVG